MVPLVRVLAQTAPATTPPSAPAPSVSVDPPQSVGEAGSLIWESVLGLWEGFVTSLPLILVGLVIIVTGVFVARSVGRASKRGITHAGADVVVSNLTERLVRIVVIVLFVLLALSVAGVSISAALAGLGIAGLAFALALQGILENFVAGLIVIMQKPFRAGDEIAIEDFQGQVTDIDLRTTRLRTYNGEMVVIPNTVVFQSTLVNLTHAGVKRTQVEFGVDYRDDHDGVAAVVEDAIAGLDGVLDEPAVTVRCTGLGDSSVDFELRYWCKADRPSVIGAQDVAVRATKTALEANGYTIPWPIRTLVMDDVVSHRKATEP